MTARLLLLCVGLLASTILLADESNLVLTIAGTTYSNVTWGAATPATVTMFYEAGVATVGLEKLPVKYQKQFNYDPARAQAYRVANAPPPEPPVKMLDRTETGDALARATQEQFVLGFRLQILMDNVGGIRGRYKQLLELQKTGHPDYRAAIGKFRAACERAIDCHYLRKKGAPPRAPDRMGGTDLDNNIARQNIDSANAAIDSYNKDVQRAQDEALGFWAEGQKLKQAADDQYRPPPPPPKPKPTPTNPYLQEVP